MDALLIASLHPLAIGGIVAVVLGVISGIIAFTAFIDFEEGIAIFFGIVAVLLIGFGAYGIFYGDYLNRVA